MATAPPAADPKAKPAGKPQPVLPEERFWVRYSPHHEMPLSGVSSFAAHTLAVGLLVIGYFLIPSPFKKSDRIPFEPVSLTDPGGGGRPGGTGVGPGAPGTLPQEDLGNDKGKQPENPEFLKQELPKLTDAEKTRLTIKDDPVAQRYINQPNENFTNFAKLDQSIQKSLIRGLDGSPGKGGTGTDGGKGPGRDKDEGAGVGTHKKQPINVRMKRLLRWKMVFDVSPGLKGGQDYLKQLQGIDAILAIPVGQKPNGEPHYKVIRDLKARPAKLLEEDLDKIERIFWFDRRRESVASLADALGLRTIPPEIVAFIPKELEDQLFKLELGHKGLTEQQIESRNLETEFKFRRQSDGKYEPYVFAQMPRQIR